MNSTPKTFKFGETAIRTVKTFTPEGEVDQIIGTEEVEIIGIASRFLSGQVIVRPFHGDAHIVVSIKDLSKV